MNRKRILRWMLLILILVIIFRPWLCIPLDDFCQSRRWFLGGVSFEGHPLSRSQVKLFRGLLATAFPVEGWGVESHSMVVVDGEERRFCPPWISCFLCDRLYLNIPGLPPNVDAAYNPYTHVLYMSSDYEAYRGYIVTNIPPDLVQYEKWADKFSSFPKSVE